MSTGPKRFVAIANTEYVGLPALPRAARDSRALADAFEQQQHFEAIVLTDPGLAALAEAANDVLAPGSLAGGTLIVSWIGHGRIGADNTLRLMGRVGKADDEVASAGKLAEWAARTGASQVLVLVDTCFSAKGMAAAASMALAIDQGRVTAGRSWFCMVAASQAHEQALSGALSGRFLTLLTKGPRVPDPRWDRRRPYIRGDDVTNELLSQWDEPRQTPHRFTIGPADDLIDNLFHEPFLADQPLEHLLRAGRGSEDEVSFFTGREDALARIVDWRAQGRPGLFVVSGPPGCGKSAVAGRIVSLSSPAERRRVLERESVPAALDPGEGSVHAQLQARAVTLEAAAEQIARQLGLDPKLGVYGVLSHAQTRRAAGTPLFIVIDGLDEARALAPSIASKFLTPLAAEALVLVTTRDTLTDEGSLIDLLQPVAVRLDLAEAKLAGQRDVHRYVLRRLENVDPRMDAAQVADEVAPLDDASMATTFLLAWLVTSQLRADPVATDDADWRRTLAFTVESALEKDLRQPMTTAAGTALDADVARTMLRALSLAYGNGLPADDVWPAVASAIAADGRVYTRDDAFAVLGALGRHVIASYEEKQPVYRIAHQRLIDHLLQPDQRAAAGRQDSPVESLLAPVADAIARLYGTLLESGVDPRAPVYLWRYAWRHLAAADEFGIGLIERLVAHDRAAFLPDLAAGLEFVGNEVWSAGEAARGLSLREAAVDVRRELGEPFRLVSALLDLTIWRAVMGQQAGADQAAQEAFDIARRLIDQPGGSDILAAALVGRAFAQLREGRLKAARMLARQAIELEEADVEDDDAGVPWQRRATVRLIMGLAENGLGNQTTALEHCRSAVGIVDHHDADGAHAVLLREALGAAAYAEFAIGALTQPRDDGTFAPIECPAGERALAEHRRTGSLDAAGDLATAKGVLFLVRTRLLNEARSHEPPADGIDSLTILDVAMALLRPHVHQLADAALLLLACQSVQATDAFQRGDPRCTGLMDEGIGLLRPFATKMSGMATELGVVLDAKVDLQMREVLNGTIRDLGPLIELQQEAISLLRGSDNWTHRQALASALTRLADLQLRVGATLDVGSRAEAIAAWRELVDVVPQAVPQLTNTLLTQAARLLGNRVFEALELADEAFRLGQRLPLPTYGVLRGLTELNLAAVQVQCHRIEGARALLESAIDRIEAAAETPESRSWLGCALFNLAQIAIAERSFDEGLSLATRAVALFADPRIPSYDIPNRIRAQIVLGIAQQGAGLEREGAETLGTLIRSLLQAVLADENDGTLLVAVLNNPAIEMWDEVLAALAARPAVARQLSLVRTRPVEQVAVTVKELAATLATAELAEVASIREAIRAHRYLFPDAFDAAWLAETGELPAWLSIDPDLHQAVIAWWNAPNWRLARDYLASHPALLDPAVDLLIDELSAADEDQHLHDLHRDLAARARTIGVEAAYAPLLLEIEIVDWLDSPDPQIYLAEHAELKRAEVLERLRQGGEAGDDRAATGAAILGLAMRDEATLAFDTLEHPGDMAARLQGLLKSPDFDRLGDLATIVLHNAEPLAERRQAAVVLWIVRLLTDRADITDPFTEAALAEPADDLDVLTALVTEAIFRHPAAAAGLATLVIRLNASARSGPALPAPTDAATGS